MTLREAVKVLMLSPAYFRMDLKARMVLVREFCENFYDRAEFSGEYNQDFS